MEYCIPLQNRQPEEREKQTERRRKSHVKDRNNNEELEETWFNNAQGITRSRAGEELSENCARKK